jgi:HEAT repeat protein
VDWNSWITYLDLDEPSESSGRGMRALSADVNPGAPVPADDWLALVAAVAKAGVPALLARLEHPDPEVRRMVSHALVWRRQDAATIVPALLNRLDHEPDPPARVGIVLAIAYLTGDVTAELASDDPARRFAAALGLATHRDDYGPAVLGALVSGLDEGGAAFENYWGEGWDDSLGAAVHAVEDPASRLDLVLRVAELSPLPAGFPAVASGALSNGFAPGGVPHAGFEAAPALVLRLAGVMSDPATPAPVRESAASVLAGQPAGVARPVVDALAEQLDAPALRDHVGRALALSGDKRSLPVLRDMIDRDPLPPDMGALLAEMRDHAQALIPQMLTHLEKASPLTVIFLKDNRTTGRGGIQRVEPLIHAARSWGEPARPLVSHLRRLLTAYEAERARCTGRLVEDYWPLVHPVRLLTTALASIEG